MEFSAGGWAGVCMMCYLSVLPRSVVILCVCDTSPSVLVCGA